MIVNGIEWSHPPVGGGALGYYGYNPGEFRAAVDDLELTAWLRTTDKYETFWTVKVERSGERLAQMNFIGQETALVGAAILVETLGEAVA